MERMNVEKMLEAHLSVELPQTPVDVALGKKPERKSRCYYNKISRYGNEFVRDWTILKIDPIEKINSYVCLVEKEISSTFATHIHQRGEKHMEYAKIFYLVSKEGVKYISSISCFEGKTAEYESFNYKIVEEISDSITIETDRGNNSYDLWCQLKEFCTKEVENKNAPW